MIRSLPVRSGSWLCATALALALGACGGGDGGTAPNVPPTTGSLVVSVSGLPAALTPSLALVTADGASRAVIAGDTVRNLLAGAVTLRPASPSAAGVGRWVPFQEVYNLTIAAGLTATQTVQYAAAQMLLTPAATGLPPSAIPTMQLTAPDGAVYTISAGAPFVTSTAGAWTMRGLPVSASDYRWAPVGPPAIRTILPGDTATASIGYEVTSGAIAVTAPGLDPQVTPTFTVTQGTLSISRQGPGVFPDLAPGPWQISATGVTLPGMRWLPGVSPQSVTVTRGATNTVNIPYTSAAIEQNLAIEGAYLTQATQRFDGTAPLVAGREALLRVFLRATETNTWRPLVRVSLYRNSSLLERFDIPAQLSSVDTSVREGSLQRSWNVRVNGDRIVPGLRVLVEADPDRGIADDADLDDNVWPRDGTPASVTVLPVDTWRVLLVPVTAGEPSLTGNVTEANKNAFTSLVRRLMPIHELDVRVRAEPYVTSAPELQANDANGSWLTVLSELNALRAIEAQPGEYFYGVVKVGYTSGIAGYGFVPGRTAMGWDYLPSGDGIAAHEWGHNFGRRHAPCGSVSGADPGYPTPGGQIGNWGWNSLTNSLVSPIASDLMGYCGNQWISAYNWTFALNYRNSLLSGGSSQAAAAMAALAAPGRLLIWGSMQDGRVQLEPSFFVNDASSLPDAPPASDVMLRVEALDDQDRVLASTVTPAARVDHDDAAARAFAVLLPLSEADHARMASVRVHDVRAPVAGVVRRRARVATAVEALRPLGDDVRMARAERNLTRVEWSDPRVRGALVRDAATGRVLSILRASGTAFALSKREIQVVLSDGVRSRTTRIRVP